MSAITAKASRKMKKYAVLTREPRCFLGSFDFSWEQRKLGDVVQITMGQSPDGSTYSDEPSDYILVQGNADLQNGWVCPRIWTTQITKKADAGDLIMSVRAPAGAMGKTAYNAVIGRGVAAIKGNEFIYQLLVKMDADGFWKTLSCGSTFESLNSDNIKNAEVKIPTTAEQIKIGGYFQQLDNLITLHQRKCVFLFGFFQAFISMIFTASTFSWEQRKLTEFVEFFSGLTYTPNDVQENGTLVLRSSNVSNGEVVDADNVYVNPQVVNSENVKVGDIVVVVRNGSRSLIGKHAQIKAFMPNTVIGAFMTGIRSECPEFTNALLNTSRFEEEIAMNMGATINQITGYMFSKMEFKVPCLDEQKKIGEYFEKLDRLVTLHQRECISFTARAGRRILTANKKRNTSSWEQRKLGELVDRVVRKNTNNESTLPLTISAQYGLVDQITYFNNRVASRDVSNYYLVLNGEFAYNKSTSDGYPFGAVKRLDLYEKGVLSTLYIVFAPKKEQQIDSDYLTVFFDTDRWHKGVAERAAEGARNHGLLNISAEDFFDIDLSVPKDIVEQKQIGAFIRQLDNLITLHQRKPFLMKWRTSDANRNKTNRLVL